jgi:heat shock protein HslJ
VKDAAMSIGVLATTRMMCADDVMQQAASFQEALAATASSTIDGASLTLSDDTGAMLLGFDGGTGSAA